MTRFEEYSETATVSTAEIYSLFDDSFTCFTTGTALQELLSIVHSFYVVILDRLTDFWRSAWIVETILAMNRTHPLVRQIWFYYLDSILQAIRTVLLQPITILARPHVHSEQTAPEKGR